MLGRVKHTLLMWRRIVALSSKPSTDEYLLLLRLSLLGFALIGSIGFTIHMLYVLLTSR
ncbi:MAG: SecE/sec61-gamma family protein translocase subunit [Acidilobaceae archaeon]|nr:protein translocase SEC61 complex subunit gamma [Desulfurococcaceae archaeon]MCC6060200.1 protein translocase SEC61 complex subunit gamma [Desulfurococcaceae archaeon]MDT7866567.1 protein translocase SEC61 complex subunit gamma [Desulfurococcales archaeon]